MEYSLSNLLIVIVESFRGFLLPLNMLTGNYHLLSQDCGKTYGLLIQDNI